MGVLSVRLSVSNARASLQKLRASVRSLDAAIAAATATVAAVRATLDAVDIQAASQELPARNLTSRSTVKPTSRARSLLIMADHQREGIESRCHHLETEAGRAPTSDAIASRVGQSSMTARKESMPARLRRNVLSRKPHAITKAGLDQGGQNVLSFDPMGQDISEEEFLKDFTGRIRAARERMNWTQAQMAKLLDIEQGTYHKYEGRTPMPHRLLMRFCFHTGVTIQHIYYGSGASAATARAERKGAA